MGDAFIDAFSDALGDTLDDALGEPAGDALANRPTLMLSKQTAGSCRAGQT